MRWLRTPRWNMASRPLRWLLRSVMRWRSPPLACHHPHPGATKSRGDLRGRAASACFHGLDLGADLGRSSVAPDPAHGGYRRAVDDDYLRRWVLLLSVIGLDAAGAILG